MIEKIITGDLGVNTYLYNFKDNDITIIDPGSDSDKIESTILAHNYTPKAILLTHGHFDHIGAVKKLKESYNIPVYIHREDATFLGDGSEKRHKEMFQALGGSAKFYFDNYFVKNDNVDYELNDGEQLDNYGLKIIHTPGHSPGSVCFYSKENSVVFTGDTMFKGGMGRTDFPEGNYPQLLESLEKLKALPKETLVYPGHGGSTTIKEEV